jgi:DnaJ family protein C protein 8
MTMKLFADMERKRRDLEQRDMEERKRKREQEIEEEEKATIEKEWQKNFEVKECDLFRQLHGEEFDMWADL